MSSKLPATRMASTSLSALLIFAVLALIASSSASATLITPIVIKTEFNTPIGLQYDEEKSELLASVNYYAGTPYNFDTIASGGTHTQFTTTSGLTDEVYPAAIRNSSTCKAAGGYHESEVYYGTGTPGQIAAHSARPRNT